jgi:hypothetical protein
VNEEEVEEDKEQEVYIQGSVVADAQQEGTSRQRAVAIVVNVNGALVSAAPTTIDTYFVRK